MAEVKDKIVTVESLAALHEHNKNTYFSVDNTAELASVIQALINDGSVCTLRSATRIESAAIYNKETFTGTGKGKLFISVPSENYAPSVNIDGVDIGTVMGISTAVGSTVEIEFLESFVVTGANTNTNSYKSLCNAVFY